MMTSMKEFWIGLVGALVGGLFTVGGTILQSWFSNRAAHMAQARSTAQRGVEAATTLAITVQRQAYHGHGTFDQHDGWSREFTAQQSSLTAVLGLLPDDQEETRNYAFKLLDELKHWRGQESWQEYRIRTTLFLGEMAVWLLALARGSKPPQSRDVEQAATVEILEYRLGSLEAELELLNQRGEWDGLDDQEMERAREIQAELEQIRVELARLRGNQSTPGPVGQTAQSGIISP
jgi:hypothetical protein